MRRQLFLHEHLAHVKKLIVVDYHTGLGEPGAAEMITEDLPGSAAYKRQHAIWGSRVASSEAGESLSAPLTAPLSAQAPAPAPAPAPASASTSMQ